MSQISTLHRETFRTGSKTYYNSSVFFPESVREDVYVLYGFVRTADNFVDRVPQDRAGFEAFRVRYSRALRGTGSGDHIIDSFVELLRAKQFEEEWVEAFLDSMELDLTKQTYQRMQETLEYIYGSAEVIGLFMCRILGIGEEAYTFARLQGRAMQYINFIRDVEEDHSLLGRTYLPLGGSGFNSLSRSQTLGRRREFAEFIRSQIARYSEWQSEAQKGYQYIPKRYRVPIKTAADMYAWTARRIYRDPFLIFESKVKPRKSRVLFRAHSNIILS